MRKWVIITVAVLAVVGVGGYVLSQGQRSRLERGTVEWHKSEYLAAYRDYRKNFALRVAGALVNKVAGTQSAPGTEGDPQLAVMKSHTKALVDLNFLARRKIAVTNAAYNVKWAAGYFGIKSVDALGEFIWVELEHDQCLVVTAPTLKVSEIEASIRQHDALQR